MGLALVDILSRVVGDILEKYIYKWYLPSLPGNDRIDIPGLLLHVIVPQTVHFMRALLHMVLFPIPTQRSQRNLGSCLNR